MSDEPIIPFRPKGKPEQLTREELRAMYKRGDVEEIERARKGGHLNDVLGISKPEPIEPPAPPVRS